MAAGIKRIAFSWPSTIAAPAPRRPFPGPGFGLGLTYRSGAGPIADRLAISDQLSLDPSELEINYVRSPGPGGQNVNKVATAAQLRFDLRGSPSLPGAVKARAVKLAGSRLTTDGVLIISATRHRTQTLNREDAVARLIALLREAAVPPKHRRATRPTLASKRRRLDAKTRRGGIKQLRSGKPSLE